MHMFATNAMKQSSFDSKPHDEPDEFDLKEWALKAKVSRENTNSRRFSASNFKSFRENQRSFGSNINISSTVSSPGYNTIRDEINPATYSFTNALKALQARTVYSNTWEYLSPDNGGLTLNSKWNDAEKYICNPLSGQVPLQCLSSKALISGSSSQSLIRSKLTLSAPLIYQPSQLNHFQTKSSTNDSQNQIKIVAIQEEKRSTTRDVGTQIKFSSKSPIPSLNPSIEEKSIKPIVQEETRDSIVTSKTMKSQDKVDEKVQEKEMGEKRNEGRKRKKVMMMMTSTCSDGGKGKGCLSFINFWRQKTRNQNNNATLSTFLCHVNASFQQ
ncbi:cytochrome b/b6 protein [Striga asiatica]|uniref:Cytochrome b/b6 protein n=1 Tax=Striga asiatica TaxID=4170 RepID=A0A5A7QBL5_STRAF|nr:cytochrome b/b6 protein [Striga asiatica]